MSTLAHQWLGTVDYTPTWELQRRLALARRDGDIEDCVLLLEHPPVYTMGRNGEAAHMGAGPDALRDLGADVVDVDRGGSVTFHGPGQLVAYPIIAIAERFPLASAPGHGDVIRYVRALEEAVIATVAELGLVDAGRRPPYTGVWLAPDVTGGGHEKLAAIGVKLAGGVTTHGIGLNLTTDLAWFEHITPCGIEDGSVCSLRSLTGASHRSADVAALLAGQLALHLGLDLSAPSERLAQLLAGAVVDATPV